jgi:hypothetical protein
MNLNAHFRCAIPDGVFVRENGSVRFVELAPPSDDDVMAVLHRAVASLEPLLRPRLMAAQADARPMDARTGRGDACAGDLAARHRTREEARGVPQRLVIARGGAPARERP